MGLLIGGMIVFYMFCDTFDTYPTRESKLAKSARNRCVLRQLT